MVEPALDQVLRARMMLALRGLIVLGSGLIAVVVLGARAARRTAKHRPPGRPIGEDRWYARPLVPEVSDDPSDSTRQSHDEGTEGADGADNDLEQT